MPQQTSIYQLPYPEPTDIPDVPEDMRRLAEAVEIAIDSSIPVGVIMAWGGVAAPSGWHLCDGTPHGSPELQAITGSANAPDLRDRFIVGAGGSYARGATGGANTVRLTAATSGIGAHVHGGSATVNVPAHQHHVQAIGGVWSSGHNTDHAHWNPNIHRWSFTGGGHDHGIQLTDGSGSGDGSYVDSNPTRGSHRNIAGNTTGGGHEHAVDIGGYHTGGVTADHAHHTTIPAHWTDAAGQSGAVALSISASQPTDASADHENRPPYYALMYIIKKA